MGTEQQQRTEKPEVTDEHKAGTEEQQRTEKPEVTDEHKAQAKKMFDAYDEDKPTTSLPGTGGTISGTAVTDWVDDKDKGNIETSAEEGEVEYRKTAEFRKKQEE